MRGCTLLSSARAVIIAKYRSLSLSLSAPPSHPIFFALQACVLSAMILHPPVIFYPYLSFCFTVPLSLLRVLLSILSTSRSLTHPVCIIHVEIPECQAWPLNIHGGAAPRPFSAALPQRSREREEGEEAGRRTASGDIQMQNRKSR